MSVNIMEAAQVSPLTRRHVNDALSELHPRSGLEVLKGRQIARENDIKTWSSRSCAPTTGRAAGVAVSRG